MNDLRLTSVRRILTINSVEIVTSPVFSLLIKGQDMHYATQVLVNGQAAEFMSLSTTAVLAEVPSSVRAKPIEQLLVLTDVPVAGEPLQVRFGVGASMRALSGFDATVQTFLKIMLTTAGSDRFNRARGGSLQSVIGVPLTADNRGAVQADIIEAVQRAQDEVVSIQNRQEGRLRDDERLRSADVRSVGVNLNSSTIPIVIALSSRSGRVALTGVEV